MHDVHDLPILRQVLHVHHVPLSYHHLSLSPLLFLSHLPSLFLSPTDHHAAQLSLSLSSFLFICGRRSGGLSEVISRVSVEVEGLRGATAPCCVSWLSASVLTTANKTRQRSGNLCQHGLNQLTVARSTCYQRGPQKCCEEARCERRWHS